MIKTKSKVKIENPCVAATTAQGRKEEHER
nr:MAG TPA: hypothetical protein [Caudoviricetes sp.]